MRALFEIVKCNLPHPFASWREAGEYVVFTTVCLAGVAHASWQWIMAGAMILFLLSWPRWRELVEKAGRIDGEYIELGSMAWSHARLVGLALRLYGNAYHVPLIVAVKLLHDGAFLTGAYLFGMATRWFWFDFI